MSIQELYALLPLEILGIGSMVMLLAGAFFPSVGKKALNFSGAAITLSAGLVATFYSPAVPEAGHMIGFSGFSLFFTALSCFAAFITLLISAGYSERRPLGEEEYPSLVLFAAFGMAFLSSSTSLLGIFVGLESMTLALYILIASNKADPLSGEAGVKYLVVGAVSTAFFAFGLSLVYFDTGTLSVTAAMQAMTHTGKMSPVGLVGWAMLLVGIGFKVSLAPFHLWAPDVYEGGPAPVIAFLSTGSKAAVFAAFLRLTLASSSGWGSLVPVLWTVAVLTMAYGNIAALTQDNVKRLLAYSSIAQMGYVLVALIAAPGSGGTSAVFYLLAFVAMDLAAFGVIASFSGKDGDIGGIDGLRGLGYVYPFRSAALALAFFSLAGLPPTAGFIAKFGVFYAAVKSGYVYLAVIGIATAIISVYYYLKVVVYLYMRPADSSKVVPLAMTAIPRPDPAGHFALAVLMAAIIALGILPGGMLDLIAGFMARPLI